MNYLFSVCCLFISHCLVTALNIRLSVFLYCLCALSYQLHHSSPLAHSPTNLLPSTALTELSLGADHIENTTSNSTSFVECRPLPTNSPSTFAYLQCCCLQLPSSHYFAVIAKQWVYMPQYILSAVLADILLLVQATSKICFHISNISVFCDTFQIHMQN
jgi:hypothetical protein